ncbi:hypothetical protein GCM10014713_07660 [Streptomyces purpureus]|uniref:Uncharacterized protein n=1 Tax=Streptomyces purpureus TaxID=1951 RepID=A0A918GWY9_9ACTN|nr:hypothetical protein GCM10014713_07660 [Streptomyces purpureus]
MKPIYSSPAGEEQIQRNYEEALAAWPVFAERVHVPTRQGDTFVLASGLPQAPPLVLLHGSGANATMWRDDIPIWSRYFRTYAVDLIGEPGMSAPTRGRLLPFFPLHPKESVPWPTPFSTSPVPPSSSARRTAHRYAPSRTRST